MGLFDFLFNRKPKKQTKVQSSSVIQSKTSEVNAAVKDIKDMSSEYFEPSAIVQDINVPSLEEPETVAMVRRDQDLSSKESEDGITAQDYQNMSSKGPETCVVEQHEQDIPLKESEVSEIVQCPVSKLEVKKKASLKVTDYEEIEHNIQTELDSGALTLVLDCPVRPARIFCHSILIDKLGDLTKFIISSLYAGHSIEEIDGLTKMGAVTMKEEIEYLVRGGLVDDDQESLTELGLQYGRLLEIFDELAEGIAVALNTFADIFEPIEQDGYFQESDPNYRLPNNFTPALARNDNYANSLSIATKQIAGDTPFCWEIKNSLYTTVKIEKCKPGYKKVSIRDLDSGYRDEHVNCIKVAIPCDRIQYKARYSWIDPFRNEISTIEGLDETHDDLLSDKAKAIICFSHEERTAEILTVEINTITGSINNKWDNLEELPSDDSMFILDRYEAKAILNPEACRGIYLEEVRREKLYKIRYFSYHQMEAISNEERGCI